MARLNFDLEKQLHTKGYHAIAGVDEAGRGPLAGPVTAAAVILDPDHIPVGLNDSKKLSEAKREALFEALLTCAHASIVSIPAAEIDRINILQATLLAMRQAIAGLPISADIALIDGRDVPKGLLCEGRALVGGDAEILSIAAASILAKVTRDRILRQAHQTFPAYGFAAHKGYGTAQHLKALRELGATSLHRLSFAPLRDVQIAEQNKPVR